jgi:hypothetical protein
MADIINLRRARKQKHRDDKEAMAGANRLKFGRSKAEKEQTQAETKRAVKALDAHKRDGA